MAFFARWVPGSVGYCIFKKAFFYIVRQDPWPPETEKRVAGIVLKGGSITSAVPDSDPVYPNHPV
jgi:hypothetical protein